MKKILVIKLGALGDVVLSLATVNRIVEANPGARVVLLTAPDYAGLFEPVPGIGVVAFPRRGFIAMSRLLAWVLRQSFCTVYDLQGSLRSRAVTLLTQAPQRFGPKPSLAYRCAPPGAQVPVHAAAREDALLALAGIGPPQRPGHWPVDSGTGQQVGEWLRGHCDERRKLVLLHAGSSPDWPSKRYGEVAFRELGRQLLDRGCDVVYLGGDHDRELNARIVPPGATDATAVFPLAALPVLASHAAFAVTNDSGPMHLLAAAGFPVYAFFGPTDWRRSHATGQAERVLTAPVSCSPCYLKRCPAERRHACMKQITPDAVLARLEADGLLGNGL